MARVRLIFIVLCLSLLGLSLLACSRQPELEDLSGNITRLKDYQGKWLIVNYWAEWCYPCRKEIPELNAFYKRHHGIDAEVVGINFDGLPKKKLQGLKKRWKISYPILVREPNFNIGVVENIPATFIFSPEGKLVKSLLGPQSEAKLASIIGTKVPKGARND